MKFKWWEHTSVEKWKRNILYCQHDCSIAIGTCSTLFICKPCLLFAVLPFHWWKDFRLLWVESACICLCTDSLPWFCCCGWKKKNNHQNIKVFKWKSTASALCPIICTQGFWGTGKCLHTFFCLLMARWSHVKLLTCGPEWPEVTLLCKVLCRPVPVLCEACACECTFL